MATLVIHCNWVVEQLVWDMFGACCSCAATTILCTASSFHCFCCFEMLFCCFNCLEMLFLLPGDVVSVAWRSCCSVVLIGCLLPSPASAWPECAQQPFLTFLCQSSPATPFKCLAILSNDQTLPSIPFEGGNVYPLNLLRGTVKVMV